MRRARRGRCAAVGVRRSRADPAGGRAERAAHHDRHAARGRDRRVRQQDRLDTVDGSPRQRRRPICAGARVDGRHASLTREHSLRSVPFSPRRARKRRVSFSRECRHARDPAACPPLSDRGLRQRVSARCPVRADARVRHLRRSLPEERDEHCVSRTRTACVRHDRRGTGLDPARRVRSNLRSPGAVVRLGSPVRAALSVHAAGTVRHQVPRRAVSWRGVGGRRGAREPAPADSRFAWRTWHAGRPHGRSR
jgi:hypothetical protein